MVKKVAHSNSHGRTHAFFKKEAHVIAWLASAVILLLFINTISFRTRLNTVEQKVAASTPKANTNIGILSFSWKDNISPTPGTYQPSAGYKIVEISTEILNLQKTKVWLAPSLESYIIDDSNTKYGIVLANNSNPLKAGEYGPQTVAAGNISYGVPEKNNNQRWCYELAATNGGGLPVCVELNKYSLVQ